MPYQANHAPETYSAWRELPNSARFDMSHSRCLSCSYFIDLRISLFPRFIGRLLETRSFGLPSFLLEVYMIQSRKLPHRKTMVPNSSAFQKKDCSSGQWQQLLFLRHNASPTMLAIIDCHQEKWEWRILLQSLHLNLNPFFLSQTLIQNLLAPIFRTRNCASSQLRIEAYSTDSTDSTQVYGSCLSSMSEALFLLLKCNKWGRKAGQYLPIPFLFSGF